MIVKILEELANAPKADLYLCVMPGAVGGAYTARKEDAAAFITNCNSGAVELFRRVPVPLVEQKADLVPWQYDNCARRTHGNGKHYAYYADSFQIPIDAGVVEFRTPEDAVRFGSFPNNRMYTCTRCGTSTSRTNGEHYCNHKG